MNEGMDIITYMPMAMIVMDENMDLVKASREAFLLFGVRMHADSLDESKAALYEKLMDQKGLVTLLGVSTMKLRRPFSRDTFEWRDGARGLGVTVFTVPKNETMLYGIFFEDMTARIEAEHARETARNYLETILDSLPLGVVVMGCDLKITTMNTAQKNMMQRIGRDISLVQVVGMKASEVFPSEDQGSWDEVSRSVMDSNEVLRDIREEHGTGNNKLFFSVSYAPLHDGRGNVSGAVRITEDITRKLALEENARQAEVISTRFETVRQMAVTLNHEVNTSLTGIRANAEMIKVFGEQLSEERSAQVDAIIADSDRISGLIERITNMEEIKTVDYLSDGKEQMLEF